MGITGLLPLLRSITDRLHLDALSGQTVAVDAYSWLHKGAYSCAADLYHHRPTRAYLDFCLHRLRLFLHHRISVVLVFDGGPLPMKRGKEEEREEARQSARAKAEQMIAEGRLGEASAYTIKAIDVTPEMAHRLVKEVRRVFGGDERVKCIVAPFEADAQLAFLEQHGLVDAVVSEDSDLLLFGVKRLCVKLDGRSGFFEEIKAERIPMTRDLDLQGSTLKRLRQVCILAGCDYLESVNGMGLKTANRYLLKYGTIERVIQVLRAEGRLVPDNYEENFRRAELTFCHQRIYNPTTCRLQHLSEFDGDTCPLADDSFLGPVIPDAVVRAIAESILHPVTHEPFDAAKVEEKKVVSPFLVADRLAVKREIRAEYSASIYFPRAPQTVKRKKTIKDFFK